MKYHYLIGILLLSIFGITIMLSDNQSEVIDVIPVSTGVRYSPEILFEGMTDIEILTFDENMLLMSEEDMVFLRSGETLLSVRAILDGITTTMEFRFEVTGQIEITFQNDILSPIYLDSPGVVEFPSLESDSRFLGWADARNPNILLEDALFINTNIVLIPLYETDEQRYQLKAFNNLELTQAFVFETIDFYVFRSLNYLESKPLFLNVSDASIATVNGLSITFLSSGPLTIQLVDANGEIKDTLNIDVIEATGTVIVQFDTKGGTAMASLEIESGSILDITPPTKAGFTFNGWVDESIERAYQNGDYIFESIILTAQWSQTTPQTD